MLFISEPKDKINRLRPRLIYSSQWLQCEGWDGSLTSCDRSIHKLCGIPFLEKMSRNCAEEVADRHFQSLA